MGDIKEKYRYILKLLRVFAWLATAISVIFVTLGAFSLSSDIDDTEMLILALFAPLAWVLYFVSMAWFSFLSRLKM